MPQPNNFDFIRLVAAFCVVISHQFALTGLPEPTVLNVHSLGGFGVLIFFSVSGYLVAQSWDADPNILRFAARRLLRIWPGLAVIIVLLAFVWGPILTSLPLTEYFRHPWVKEFLLNLRFETRDLLPIRLEGNVLPLAVDGPLWTIPLELRCYLALAVLGVTGLLRTKWWVILITTLLLFPYAIVEPRGDLLVSNLGWSLEQRYLLEFGSFFAAGVILHFFRFDTRKSASLFIGAAWMLALVSLSFGRPFLALWLVIPATVVIVGSGSTPVLRRAGRFGDLSYGLYIYAFPVQQTLIWLFAKKLPWSVLFALTVATALSFAFASWHLVEKRALRFKPRRRNAAAPSPQASEALGVGSPA